MYGKENLESNGFIIIFIYIIKKEQNKKAFKLTTSSFTPRLLSVTFKSKVFHQKLFFN